MGKIGYSKPAHSSKNGEVKHSFVEGPAYDIKDPVNKLIHQIGTFFSEPTYYAGDKKNENGVTPQAQEVIDTAHAVAEASPEDLLILASWARDFKDGLKLRTTPQVLFAIAAAHKKTRNLLSDYESKIFLRADDIRTTFAAYNKLFVTGEKRTLPTDFKRALAKGLARQSDYSLIKYSTEDHPTFKDVLSMVKNKKNAKLVSNPKAGYPLSKGMYEYLSFGKVSELSSSIVKLRSEFFQNKDLSKVTMQNVEQAGLTWENVLSHFGNKKEVWELVVGVMGEMAITRNLRNFEQANLDDDFWNKVEAALLPDGGKTVQLPFRFLAAYKHITGSRAKSVVAKAFDRSIHTVPKLPGKSIIFADNSGSMNSVVSVKSEMTLKDAANSLGAILSKQNEDNAHMYVFADHVKKVNINYIDSGISILENIEKIGSTAGGGTNIDEIERTINDYRNRGEKIDRFVVLSDMCCYTYSKNAAWGINKGGLQRAFDEYRRKVNKNCFLYSINLAGYEQAQVKPEGDNIVIMSGWSEQIISLMLAAENLEKENKTVALPTIELLRSKYKVVGA